MRPRRARRPPVTPVSPPVRTGNPELASIVEMLSSSRSVRAELVEDLRGQLAEGGYATDEKLNLAIYRMLKDVLR